MRRPALTVSVSLSARGDADPDVAWQRYAELDRWQEWSPQVRRVEADGRQLREGLRGHVVGPAGVRVAFRVEAVGERTWTWVVQPAAGLAVRLHHAVVPAPGGCASTLVLRGPAPLVVPYAPVARLALGRLVRA